MPWWWNPCDGISALKSRDLRTCSLSAVWGYSKVASIGKPGRGPLARTQPCCHCDLGLRASRTVRNRFLLLKPPNLWHLVIDTWCQAYPPSDGLTFRACLSLWCGLTVHNWILCCCSNQTRMWLSSSMLPWKMAGHWAPFVQKAGMVSHGPVVWRNSGVKLSMFV